MKNLMKQQSGFSLIELMVVVGIISLLAMVAVPKFSQFQNRAKQTEATSNLAGIYTAETAFASQWNSYYQALDIIGFSPNGKVRYNCGWTAGNGNVPAAAGWTSSTKSAFSELPGISLQSDVQTAGLQAIPSTTAATATSFVASCIADFNTAGTNKDTWTIDNTNTVSQTSNGI